MYIYAFNVCSEEGLSTEMMSTSVDQGIVKCVVRIKVFVRIERSRMPNRGNFRMWQGTCRRGATREVTPVARTNFRRAHVGLLLVAPRPSPVGAPKLR